MPFKSKEARKAYSAKRVEDNRKWYREYKESQPCTDCGNFYRFWQMQFDHLGDKKLNVSLMMNHPKSSILAEIAKCELVCANCHSTRTYTRYLGD